MKRWMTLLLAGATAASLLAGCGGGGGQGGAAAGSEGGSQAAGPQAGGGTKVTMMMNGTATDPTTAVYQKIVDSFNAQGGDTLDMQLYENEQYKTKLTTLMASNSVPDIFFTWELDYLRPFVEGGKVYDLTAKIDENAAWRDTFQPGVFEPLTYEGKICAVPCYKALGIMYYNKEIFESNGVQVPATYEDFLAVCETLKGNGVTPLAIAAPDAWIPAQFVQQLADGIGGMDVYNGLLDGSVKWDNDTHVKAGQELQNIINKGYLQDGFLGMTSEESQLLFKNGKCAMYYMGTWEMGIFTGEDSAIKDVVGAFGMPPIDPQYQNIHVGSIDTSLAISANSKVVDNAFAFIQYFTNQENQETLLYETSRLPSTSFEIDESKVNPLVLDALDISAKTVGLTPWLDRAFGAGEGVEFNNKVQAICGGGDPASEFAALQQFADDNAER